MPKICENIKRCVVCVCEMRKDFLYLYSSTSHSFVPSLFRFASYIIRKILFAPKLFSSMQILYMFGERTWRCNAKKTAFELILLPFVYSSFYYFCCYAFRLIHKFTLAISLLVKNSVKLARRKMEKNREKKKSPIRTLWNNTREK